jgi:hypothetical protein
MVPPETRTDPGEEILVLSEPIDRVALLRIVQNTFGDMAKYVVDVERDLIAIGGQLHADAEQELLDRGSSQPDLWGANYYPGRGRDGCIEFTALINVRPAQGNAGMEVQDEGLRQRIRTLTFRLIGEGGAL